MSASEPAGFVVRNVRLFDGEKTVGHPSMLIGLSFRDQFPVIDSPNGSAVLLP